MEGNHTPLPKKVPFRCNVLSIRHQKREDNSLIERWVGWGGCMLFRQQSNRNGDTTAQTSACSHVASSHRDWLHSANISIHRVDKFLLGCSDSRQPHLRQSFPRLHVTQVEVHRRCVRVLRVQDHRQRSCRINRVPAERSNGEGGERMRTTVGGG